MSDERAVTREEITYFREVSEYHFDLKPRIADAAERSLTLSEGVRERANEIEFSTRGNASPVGCKHGQTDAAQCERCWSELEAEERAEEELARRVQRFHDTTGAPAQTLTRAEVVRDTGAPLPPPAPDVAAPPPAAAPGASLAGRAEHGRASGTAR